MRLVFIMMISAATFCGSPLLASDSEETAQSEARNDAPGAAKGVAAGAPAAFDQKPKEGTMAKCLVMGATFKISKSTEFSQYKGKYYAFCCPGCKPKFDANPEKYLKK